MKYRVLTDEELQHLEGDLKAFLIINGVEGDTWKKMNEQEPEKALALVELFSDKVLETVYEKLEYLEFRTVESCLVFKMGKTEQSLISIQCKAGSSLDLSTPEGIHNALKNHFSELELFTSQRNYTQEREVEIHTLITQGCLLSSAEFWNVLEEIVTTEN
jgi:hypothetical protein